MLKTCTSLKWYGNIIERLNKNFILKEADNKTEALPRASKTIQGGTVHAKKQKLVLRLTKERLWTYFLAK